MDRMFEQSSKKSREAMAALDAIEDPEIRNRLKNAVACSNALNSMAYHFAECDRAQKLSPMVADAELTVDFSKPGMGLKPLEEEACPPTPAPEESAKSRPLFVSDCHWISLDKATKVQRIYNPSDNPYNSPADICLGGEEQAKNTCFACFAPATYGVYIKFSHAGDQEARGMLIACHAHLPSADKFKLPANTPVGLY